MKVIELLAMVQKAVEDGHGECEVIAFTMENGEVTLLAPRVIENSEDPMDLTVADITDEAHPSGVFGFQVEL